MQNQSHHDFQLQEQYGAVLRALSGDSTVAIRDWQLHQATRSYEQLAPHLHLANREQAWFEPRAMLDGLAVRIRYSDQALHQKLSPPDQLGSFIFEVLEQIRVESICPPALIGSKKNLRQQFIAWLTQFMAAGQVESSIGLLLLAIFCMTWMRLNHQELPQPMQDTVEATRAGLASETGPILQQLKLLQTQQEQYAQQALLLIQLVGELVHAEYQSQPSLRSKRKQINSPGLLIDWIPPHQPPIALPKKLRNSVSRQAQQLENTAALTRYPIFNASYDLEIKAQTAIRAAQLQNFRSEIDQCIHDWQIPWGKFIRLYTKLLAQPHLSQWQNTESEGLLDRRYLNRFITSPHQQAIQKKRIPKPLARTQITFLLDCSGSMKEHRLELASFVDVMVRILEGVGVTTEVLGYSTLAWQGGRPFKEWQKSGSCNNPGRLNERAHWIFKDHQTSWRRARLGMAALLKPDLYRESLDGEALLWAAQRLTQTNQDGHDKKIILLSDGCPMDRATLQANGEAFLLDHLLHVLEWTKHTDIQVWGCGVGEEMRSAFKRRLSWELSTSKSTAPPSAALVVNAISNWAQELAGQASQKNSNY